MHRGVGTQIRRARDKYRPRDAVGERVPLGGKPGGLIVHQRLLSRQRQVAGLLGTFHERLYRLLRAVLGADRVPAEDAGPDGRILPISRVRAATDDGRHAQEHIAQTDRFRRDDPKSPTVRAEFHRSARHSYAVWRENEPGTDGVLTVEY